MKEVRGAQEKKCVLCNKHEPQFCTECYNPASVKEGMLKAIEILGKAFDEAWLGEEWSAVERAVNKIRKAAEEMKK